MTDDQKKAVLKLYGLERLENATRETWPWWDWTERASCNGHYDETHAIMPDFPNDDTAAVKLLEKMVEVDDDTVELTVSRGRVYANDWGDLFGTGRSLGESLLASLVEYYSR